MRLVVRLLTATLGVLLVPLTFVHAASENGILALAPGFFGRSGIDAHAMGEALERGYRTAVVGRRGDAFAELSPEEAVVLARDPAALEQFLEERRIAVANEQTEFPSIPEELLSLARLTYATDPLNIAALRTIALGQILHENPERARQIMRLAAQLSKRDDLTNLWLAQDYGRLGDVENMLMSFDHALRTSMRAREVAIAPVVELTRSPESHTALGALLRDRPEWEAAFWGEFSGNPVALANAANFFESSGVPVVQVPERTRQALYANLKREGYFEGLYRLAALDPAATIGTAALSTGKFLAANEANPLAWNLHSRGDFAASVHQTAGELQIDARAGSFGVAADRVVRLDGDYELAIRMAEPVPENAKLELAFVCLDGDGEELATIALEVGGEAGESLLSNGTCNFANLKVSFDVDPGRRAALIRIASISLRPRESELR